MAFNDYDATPANNTFINGIGASGSDPVSNFDNICRQFAADMKNFTTNAQFDSTDAGATAAPIITLYRNSASPAISDALGRIKFDGEDHNGNQTTYASVYGVISSPTDTLEAGKVVIETMSLGSTVGMAFRANGIGVNADTSSTIIYGGVHSISDGGTITAFGAGHVSAANDVLLQDGTSSIALRLDTSANASVFTGNVTVTNGLVTLNRAGNPPLAANRDTDDGNVILLQQAGATEGAIAVAGNTVSYGAASTFHWSQFHKGGKPDILRGTVVETVDELNEYMALRFTDINGKEHLVEAVVPDAKEGDTVQWSYQAEVTRKKLIPAEYGKVQATEEYEEDKPVIRMVDGRPVASMKRVTKSRPLFDEIEVVDENGAPVIERPAMTVDRPKTRKVMVEGQEVEQIITEVVTGSDARGKKVRVQRAVTEKVDLPEIRKTIRIPRMIDGIVKPEEEIEVTEVETLTAKATVFRQKQDRLPKFKISDTPGSSRVYGTFLGWDNGDDYGDAYITGGGLAFARIAKGVVLSGGELLESNGDGCARPQVDPNNRASLLGKVTVPHIIETYEDGSYLVPCVLYCG